MYKPFSFFISILEQLITDHLFSFAIVFIVLYIIGSIPFAFIGGSLSIEKKLNALVRLTVIFSIVIFILKKDLKIFFVTFLVNLGIVILYKNRQTPKKESFKSQGPLEKSDFFKVVV